MNRLGARYGPRKRKQTVRAAYGKGAKPPVGGQPNTEPPPPSRSLFDPPRQFPARDGIKATMPNPTRASVTSGTARAARPSERRCRTGARAAHSRRDRNRVTRAPQAATHAPLPQNRTEGLWIAT